MIYSAVRGSSTAATYWAKILASALKALFKLSADAVEANTIMAVEIEYISINLLI
jgi:hypothetical protein